MKTPLLLGASRPQALPVLAYKTSTDVDLAAWPEAIAMADVVALLSALMIWAYLCGTRARVRS